MAELLLNIKNLRVGYKVYGGLLKVLDGINIKVNKGERIGIVGETGSGKTTTAKAILRILPRTARIFGGEIIFQNKDVLKMSRSELSILRGQGISMIFQDPTASLNPVFTVGTIISDVIRYSHTLSTHNKSSKSSQIKEIAIDAFKSASLPDANRLLTNYPFQLSGGMRQRVCIAMALATARNLLIADEPTTNLDVTIQDQVLRLIKEMVDKKGTSLILITHSLGVAREMTDKIYVMYAGTIVEQANTRELFENPYHPYTHALLSCIPKLTGEGIASGIPGRMPDYLNPPLGCRFASRCPRALPICQKERPPLMEVEPGHEVACFLFCTKQGVPQ
ncbi:MAG: ABC transporter ATP-binding protein [Nitrososphaerota archaeon]